MRGSSGFNLIVEKLVIEAGDVCSDHSGLLFGELNWHQRGSLHIPKFWTTSC